MNRLGQLSKKWTWLTCVGLVSFASYSAQAQDINTLRAKYKAAQQFLEKGQMNEYSALRSELENYPLTPYLDYRVFSDELSSKTPAQVQAFSEKYKDVPFSESIRAKYLDELIEQGRWQDLVTYQTTEPKMEKYRCNYYYAHWATGNKTLAYQGAEKLFLSGKSVDAACDKLFAQWAKDGRRTDELVLERMLLSYPHLNSRFTTIMSNWLTGAQAKQQGQQIINLINNPSAVASFARQAKVTEFNQELTEMAYYQWVRKDVASAVNSYDAVMKGQQLSTEVQNYLSDYAAYRLIYTSSPSLAKWRDQALQKSRSDMVERRIRLAMENNNWQEIGQWIEYLPEDLKASPRWQYWKARVAYQNGQKSQGDTLLRGILGQRDFYSVAAAESLGEAVVLPMETLTNPVNISSKQAALNRIDEMMKEHKVSAAKAEWAFLLNNSTDAELQALAVYADKQKWPHMAILATIKAKMWGHLSLRFPVTYTDLFNQYGDRNNVSPVTMMALARQESAMDINAHSPVGARGLMQIMPDTAKYTAKKHGIAYNGVSQLNEPQKNIEIGSAYLGEQMKDYDNNRIYSFAAYNAGPSRVTRWRGRSNGRLDAYMFIETIPFKETRNYVQNILMFETYYRNLLGLQGSFLTDKEARARY